MKKCSYLDTAILLGTIIFWASAFAAIRSGLNHYSPGSIALGRFLIASLIFAVIALVRGIRIPRGKDLFTLIFWGGLLNITVYHYCLNTGEKTVQSGIASVIVALSPAIIAITAHFMLGERLKNFQKAGIIIAFAGVIILSGGAYKYDIGMLYIFVATIASSCYTVMQKQLLTKYPAIDLTACSMWFGTIFLFPYAPDLLLELQTSTFADTIPILWLGVFPSALSYTMWAYSLKRLPANRCASALYLSPVLAFIIGWLLLDEIPSLQHIIGGMVILTGIALVNKVFNRRKSGSAFKHTV